MIGVLLALLAGCAVSNPDATCAQLEQSLGNCLGTDRLPLACDDLSPGDVENLAEAIDATSCALVDDLLPLDGDPVAASCNLLGEGCATSSVPAFSRGATRYPLVLVNGIDVSPLFSWSERIVDVLEFAGHDVHLAVVPPYDSTPTRSAVLWQRVQDVKAETRASRVNLVCHSLGGLDCRYLVSPGGLHWEVDATQGDIAGSVATITTVGTAHHGTPAADIALGFVEGEDPSDALNRLATLFGSWLTEDALTTDVQLRSALGALTESQTLAFNAEIGDDAGIEYQSWGGTATPWGQPEDLDALRDACATDTGDGLDLYVGTTDHLALPLHDSYDLVAEEAAVDGEDEAPNDGLAPVRSTRWGTFRGCVPADHMEQLGRGNLPSINVRTRVDIGSFYADIARDLAERGF